MIAFIGCCFYVVGSKPYAQPEFNVQGIAPRCTQLLTSSGATRKLRVNLNTARQGSSWWSPVWPQSETLPCLRAFHPIHQIWQIISFILPPNEDGSVYDISTSYEAHFDLGGYVNKQNCRLWGTENPHANIEQPTHSKRVLVWCGLRCRGIIGQFFFENEKGEAVAVNGDRYWAMLNKFLFTRRGYWQHLVSTGRRYVPHSQSYLWCFAPCFCRKHYQPQSWCRLATSELRFDTLGQYSWSH